VFPLEGNSINAERVCSIRRGFVVESYEDSAVGHMTRNTKGQLWVSNVTSDPKIEFSVEKQRRSDQVAQLHHEAHE
jgi:hypothetical protein